jgi:thymidylate kinase
MSAAVDKPIPGRGRSRSGGSLTASPTLETDEAHTPADPIHPVLVRAFVALDEAGVDWCLLRGGANLAAPTGDVDLLVSPASLGSVDGVFDDLGALRHRSWGRGSHRFFVVYDPPSARWLKFDLVSELAFDPRQAVVGPTGDGVLARRQRDGATWVASRADAFWLLLLHCVLDKAAFSDRYQAELGELSDSALEGGPELRAWVEGLSPRRWREVEIVDAVRLGRWNQLLALGRAIRRASARQEPAAFVLRSLRAVALRRASRLVGPVVGKPPVIALVGPDGTGKSSVARRLVEWWPAGGRVVHLGLYTRAIRGGPFGRIWHLAHARLATIYHLLRGRLIVLDRHPIEDREDGDPWHRIRVAVMRLIAPRPTRVVVLDTTADELARRRPDHDPAWLERKRGEFRQLAALHPEWALVDASPDLETVTADVATIAWETLRPDLDRHTEPRHAARG